MRILDRYVGRDFLVTFLITVLVVTFVLCVGALLRSVDLMARGISIALVGRFFLQNIPKLLMFTIPVGILISTLLMFERVSSDGEITALKSCGVSLWNVVAPVLLWALLFSGVCFLFSGWLSPRSAHANRQLLRSVGLENPVDLLEEGRFVRELPGLMIYIGSKDGRDVEDVLAYELAGERVRRSVRAERGSIRVDDQHGILRIELENVRIQLHGEEEGGGDTKYISARRYPLRVDIAELTRRGEVKTKANNTAFPALVERISSLRKEDYPGAPQAYRIERMELITEANRRLTLPLSCLTFALLGTAIGVQGQRKDSSLGIVWGVVVLVLFYAFLLLADGLGDRPQLRPDLVIWTPVVLGQGLGCLWLARLN
ncbi:LptF/LptG family permease [Kiritimatiella glycovorans]|uniref:Lipopolysaccharide ABC transporter permease LptF n=1 Tax=Kiritimatiella glycovorans TaxID=1307763 RepID=A0A0G3ELN8_9BACT|nr:LptF/LptG family permease [Kiritimatiella glycovorans]AKJ65074.1 lipopolysaccharide ABC transporter permease LptF [Kiritimatiella glycovorans]